jgi:hypothetical protein
LIPKNQPSGSSEESAEWFLRGISRVVPQKHSRLLARIGNLNP